MKTIASLDICLNKRKKNPNFILFQHAPDRKFGMAGAWGDLLMIESQQMRKAGLNMVKENLAQYALRDLSQGSEFDRMSRPEQRKFTNQHKFVAIGLKEDGSLSLHPMEKTHRGGMVGEPENEIILSSTCSNADFFNSLMEAFEKV